MLPIHNRQVLKVWADNTRGTVTLTLFTVIQCWQCCHYNTTHSPIIRHMSTFPVTLRSHHVEQYPQPCATVYRGLVITRILGYRTPSACLSRAKLCHSGRRQVLCVCLLQGLSLGQVVAAIGYELWVKYVSHRPWLSRHFHSHWKQWALDQWFSVRRAHQNSSFCMPPSSLLLICSQCHIVRFKIALSLPLRVPEGVLGRLALFWRQLFHNSNRENPWWQAPRGQIAFSFLMDNHCKIVLSFIISTRITEGLKDEEGHAN